MEKEKYFLLFYSPQLLIINIFQLNLSIFNWIFRSLSREIKFFILILINIETVCRHLWQDSSLHRYEYKINEQNIRDGHGILFWSKILLLLLILLMITLVKQSTFLIKRAISDKDGRILVLHSKMDHPPWE